MAVLCHHWKVDTPTKNYEILIKNGYRSNKNYIHYSQAIIKLTVTPRDIPRNNIYNDNININEYN